MMLAYHGRRACMRFISVYICLKCFLSYHWYKEDEDFDRDDQDICGVSSHGGPVGNYENEETRKVTWLDVKIWKCTWLDVGYHPSQSPSGRPSAPADQAPSQLSPDHIDLSDHIDYIDHIDQPYLRQGFTSYSHWPTLVQLSSDVNVSQYPQDVSSWLRRVKRCIRNIVVTSPAGRAHTMILSASELRFSLSSRIIRGQNPAARNLSNLLLMKFSITWKLCGQCKEIQDHSGQTGKVFNHWWDIFGYTFHWIWRAFAHHPFPSLWIGRAIEEMLELRRG